ncbi:hypothetical protein GCM10007853_18640 [Algimonas ampicilliniresistens]|uniref:Uncharacterized protein n=1 Tax=Algimonas ampicilliniresistens TaxID=1298735 RepID=A0ABQ5VBB8_9PROT|nr:hypothetical protein [Algimonas ampicilliniresistens]GLQ23990.1 hypothetical protein GCM10007853_18640 [Algimonas ampicilliniresistens]
MKFHRLLAGTAVAALMASNASALSISLAATSPSAPGPGGAALVASDLIEAPIVLAQERPQNVVANAGTFALNVTTNNVIASANNYFIVLEILNGTFATQVDADDLINGTGGTATVFNGTTVQFDGANRTGEVGDSSVRFLSSATTGGDNFSIVFDSTATCAGPLNFRVTLSTESNTAIEQGVVTLATPAATCVDAYQVTVASDETGPFDSLLVATAFQNFNTAVDSRSVGLASSNANNGGINDDADEATIGNISIAFDPTNTGAPRPVFPTLLAAEDVATGFLAGVPAEIGVVSLTVAVDSSTGVQGVGLRAAGGATNALTAGSASFTYDPAAIGPNVAAIEIDVTGSDTLQEIQPTATAGTVSFTGAAAGLATENITRANGGLLDKLQYAGSQCGTFDWVGDGTVTRRNVFRVTNFANSQTDGIFASMTNSSAGLPNATLPINGTVTVSGAEMSFTDVELTSVFGNYGRADFAFNFIGATSSLDCDRLQSSPVSSVVTGFGNGTGNAEYGDGDD